MRALKAKGHELRSVDGGSVGGYQGILFTRDPNLPAPTFDRISITEDLTATDESPAFADASSRPQFVAQHRAIFA